LCLGLAAVPGFAVEKVLGLETGYAYLFSATDVAAQYGNGLLANVYFGFEVGDNPRASSLLSLVLGYGAFPDYHGLPLDERLAALHDAVFGLEYAYTFFYGNPIAFMLNGGMMANLLVQAGGQSSAFGHHTRLGLGPVFRLSRRDSVALLASYNLLIFPHADRPTDLFHFPAVVLRYQHRL
jgi:hypothetical protein